MQELYGFAEYQDQLKKTLDINILSDLTYRQVIKDIGLVNVGLFCKNDVTGDISLLALGTFKEFSKEHNQEMRSDLCEFANIIIDPFIAKKRKPNTKCVIISGTSKSFSETFNTPIHFMEKYDLLLIGGFHKNEIQCFLCVFSEFPIGLNKNSDLAIKRTVIEYAQAVALSVRVANRMIDIDTYGSSFETPNGDIPF